MSKIKVLVIDDSAVTRQVLTKIISADAALQVIDTALDATIALRKIEKHQPDVITLDLELPKIDGITFLKKLMKDNPMPVVVISSLSQRSSRKAIEALEAGALEIITKPDVSSPEKLAEVAANIHEAIKAAFEAKLSKSSFKQTESSIETRQLKAQIKTSSSHIVAIGASTGGTEAIKEILCQLPPTSPGIVIVQHMPEMFTRSFAERLNTLCDIIVKEAEDNDEVIDGRALIAPGNKHITVVERGKRFFVRLSTAEKVNRHRPSVDVLFRSLARIAGQHTLGILLTGMGEDGAAGLLEIRNKGGHTVAQDRGSSVVFGMPRRAIELGAACDVLSLTQISKCIQNQSYVYEK